MNKLKINLIGIGIEIKRMLLPIDQLEEWKVMIGQTKTITEALLDPFFYFKLNDPRFTSLEDLPSEKCNGIINSDKSHIEFWFNRKKMFKAKTTELLNDYLLFPLFKVERSQIPFMQYNGIYILQKEIGTIGSYEVMVDSNLFKIDDFTFLIDSCQDNSFIKNILYKDQELKLIKKKDAVITYQFGFEYR